MVYDVFDSDNDGADDLSLGFSPIYQALTSKDFVDSSALTTIYLFSDVLNGVVDSEAQTSIRTLLEGERIFGTGSFGVGETNNGGVSVSLPLYTVLSVGSSVSICSTNIEGEGNALGVRRFVRINIPSEGTYTISLSKTSGEGTRDPDAILMEVGAKVIKRMFSAEADFESSATTFAAGDYILEVYDDKNNDNDSSTGGIVCFDVSLN